MRVCTFPTLHGERTVVRLFGGTQRYQRLDDLGLPDDVLQPLRLLLSETSGAILVSGPAGSGKTTTVYACLREIAQQGGGARSLVSIEDPIEVAVDGVAQSQVNPPAGLDLASGLRFLMRQDPEVIMVGEIRDRATADTAFQASLTGHLLLSTFHAGSAAETIGRLSDMGIEPYVLRSGLLAILNQRLLRRLCSCAELTDDPAARLGLAVQQAKTPRGCDKCGGTGYLGRFLLVEMLTLSRSELARAILAHSETALIERLAAEAGMLSRWQRACRAVDAGLTSPAEVRRVLGFSGGGANGHCQCKAMSGQGFQSKVGWANRTQSHQKVVKMAWWDCAALVHPTELPPPIGIAAPRHRATVPITATGKAIGSSRWRSRRGTCGRLAPAGCDCGPRS